MLLPNNATASFPAPRVSPMNPEPVTMAKRINEPKNSEK
jgi:hypothetical protein